MKLYTEEQVRIAIQQARHYEDWWDMVYEFETDDIIKDLTPVELPSDEEIREGGAHTWVFKTNSMKWSNNNDEAGDNFGSFIAGAKWMRDKILNK